MRKVKVVLGTEEFSYDCDGRSYLYPVSADWEEVSEKEYEKLLDAVQYANLGRKFNDGKYILVSYSDDTMEEVFKKASDFLKKIEKQKLAQEKKKAEAKEKREANAKAKKLAQFEKLKKELEI